jgi:branched-chain amino acid transport system substrate-binding protein
MQALIHVLDAAGTSAGNHTTVVKDFFAIKNRSSVLGTYSIDKNGDTSLTDYGIYKISSGKLTFDKVIKAQGG